MGNQLRKKERSIRKYIEACFAPTHNRNAWEWGLSSLTGKSVLEAKTSEGRGLVDGDEGARNGAQHCECVCECECECVSGEDL